MNTDTRESGEAVAWTALVVAVLALVFSLVAFNRSGIDVNQVVKQELGEALIDFETRYERLENEVRQSTSEDTEEIPGVVPMNEDSADVGTSS